MPWKETDVIDERLRFVALFSSGALSMTELCERFGVTRPTGYKWVQRYGDLGREGLVNQPRSPKKCPHRTPESIEKALVRAREKHPRWGPITIRALLQRAEPKKSWPAASTIGEILKRHGLVQARKQRRRPRHPGQPFVEMKKPNDVWSADFKGEFKTRDGRLCYPLTIADGCSRFVLACRARRSVHYEGARPVFEEAFSEYGLPFQILTDNGSPFVSRGLTGLTRLSVWFIELGIHPIRIQPGHPEQNGRHERMHRTLKEEIYPPAGNQSAQQRRLNQFRREFNEIRPHRSLDLRPPADVYEPSSRRYSRHPSEISYPSHFIVRTLYGEGDLYWKGRRRRICKALCHKSVGLEAVEEDLYHVYFGPVLLCVYDTATGEIHS